MSLGKSSQKSLFDLLLGAGGIYFSYVVVGIYLQNLYNSQFQSNVQFNQDGTPVKHRFNNPELIVWLTGLCCSIFGYLKSVSTKERKNPIPIKQSFLLGLLFAVGMGAGNFSLLYVSYPTHSLGKNAKYLFVVLIGAFLSRVPSKDNLKLPKHKMIVAFIITTGVIIFNLMKQSSKDTGDHHLYPEEWKGYILLIVAMVAQAQFSDSQAYCKSKFKPSANHLFTSANFVAFLILSSISAFSGKLIPSLTFLWEHPQFLKQLGLVCVLQVTGQVSIYYIVANFKQHIFPLIASTRKVITIFCSIFIYHHTLNYWQWLGMLIVFIGMIIEVRDQIQESKNKHSKIKSESQSQATASSNQLKEEKRQ